MYEVLMKWCVLIIPIPCKTRGRYQVAMMKYEELESEEVADNPMINFLLFSYFRLGRRT